MPCQVFAQPHKNTRPKNKNAKFRISNPLKRGGDTRIRTEDQSFAGSCLTTWLCRLAHFPKKWCPEPDLNRHGKKFHRILSPVRLPISPPRHKNLLSLTRIRLYNNQSHLSSIFSSFFKLIYFQSYIFLFSASSKDLYPLCFTIFSRFFSARFLFSILQFFT